MNIQEGVFLAICAITIGSALMAVVLKNVFYCALWLSLCLFGVAGIFVYLNSEFLAIIEVIVYIGAISVAIIFAIMLSETMYVTKEKRNPRKFFRSLAVGVALFIVMRRVLSRAFWASAPIEGDYSIGAIGRALLTNQVLAFEAVSIVLLIAIIGALTILEGRRTDS